MRICVGGNEVWEIRLPPGPPWHLPAHPKPPGRCPTSSFPGPPPQCHLSPHFESCLGVAQGPAPNSVLHPGPIPRVNLQPALTPGQTPAQKLLGCPPAPQLSPRPLAAQDSLCLVGSLCPALFSPAHGGQEVQEGPPATLPLELGDAVAVSVGSRCGWEDTQWGWPAATEDSVTVYRTGRQSQGGASEILFSCLRKLNPREGTVLSQPLPLKPGLSLPGALEYLGRNPPSLWEAPLRDPGWDPGAWQGLANSPDPWLCIG